MKKTPHTRYGVLGLNGLLTLSIPMIKPIASGLLHTMGLRYHSK